MNTKHIELLAPVGNFASLTAALNAGANAVFFGIEDFNMRASAAMNFTFEEVEELVKQCKAKNVRTYVTINTVLYDDEIEKMRRVIDHVQKLGVDAVIAADIATIMYAKKVGMPVHISTQLSVSNIETVEYFADSAECVVLARELSLEQVKYICDEIKKRDVRGPGGELVQIEVFAHGALCVAVSGRCDMSLHTYGKSANRGKCTQICRRKYKVIDVDTGNELVVDNNYVMSSSDLCTIGMIDQLVESGVGVLKIEGRGRSPEYVDTVISCYREALDSVADGTYTKEKVTAWNARLGKVFNRGQSTGLYMGRSYDEWAHGPGNKSRTKKTHVGKVVRYYPKISVVEFEIEAGVEVAAGEQCLIIGDKTGVVREAFDGMLLDEKKVEKIEKGNVVTMKLSERVRKGDKVYVVRDEN
jgi:putative protease